ncbi:MAG: DUF3313 domain-containing protein [Spirulinaceae cyanobacterium RM2_2_10]|nr:DUF3313 domain-containing protein [Spirulinaceae cyanobacterium RM2_2_10]
MKRSNPRLRTVYPLTIVFTLYIVLHSAAKADNFPDFTHDYLVRVKDPAAADVAYVLPGVDMTVYAKVLLLEPQISFRMGWQQEYNSQNPRNRLTNSDLEKMISRASSLFQEAFVEELEARDYPIVKEAGDDVLIVRAALVNLEVASPDPNRMAGISGRTFTRDSSRATLILEIYDSVSRQIIARAIDSIDSNDRRRGYGDLSLGERTSGMLSSRLKPGRSPSPMRSSRQSRDQSGIGDRTVAADAAGNPPRICWIVEGGFGDEISVSPLAPRTERQMPPRFRPKLGSAFPPRFRSVLLLCLASAVRCFGAVETFHLGDGDQVSGVVVSETETTLTIRHKKLGNFRPCGQYWI